MAEAGPRMIAREREEAGERTSYCKISAPVLARIQIFYSILVFLIFAGILALEYETGKKDLLVNVGSQHLTNKENALRRKYNQRLIWLTLVDFYIGLFLGIIGVMYGFLTLQGCYENKKSGSLVKWVLIWCLFLILIVCSFILQQLDGLDIQCSTLFLAFYAIFLLIIRSVVIKSERIYLETESNPINHRMVGLEMDRRQQQQSRRSLGEDVPPPYHSLFPPSPV